MYITQCSCQVQLIVRSAFMNFSFYVHDEFIKLFIIKIHHKRKTFEIFLWSMSEDLQFKLGSSNYEVIAMPTVHFSHLSTRCVSWKKKDFLKC